MAKTVLPPAVRFWAKVDKGRDCWEWLGCRHPSGHGRFMVHTGKTVYAHRWVYEAAFGPVPTGLVVHHACFNPPCVNPDHLKAATHGENLRAGPAGPAFERSRITHCPQGHEYTPENTLRRPGSWGRQCRECDRARNRRNYLRRKAA